MTKKVLVNDFENFLQLFRESMLRRMHSRQQIFQTVVQCVSSSWWNYLPEGFTRKVVFQVKYSTFKHFKPSKAEWCVTEASICSSERLLKGTGKDTKFHVLVHLLSWVFQCKCNSKNIFRCIVTFSLHKMGHSTSKIMMTFL